MDIINLAIRNKDQICVWGDFDVDGQTSTALLVQTLGALGADVVYYIPVRGKESHGVHIESLKPITRRRCQTPAHLRHRHHRPRSH
ncbi:MAG: hypothetical protein M0C28_29885 [Candidatus Moduliflexus flocculans]|nr:hypothetical protein [Candidatus Moduliflexus flocculans]